MSEVKTNKISPVSASGTIQFGDSGDTFTIPSGATFANSGTATGFGTPTALLKVYQYYNNTGSSNSENGSLKPVITSNTITPASTGSVFYVESSIKGWTGSDGSDSLIEFSINNGSSWSIGIVGTYSSTTKGAGGNFIMGDSDNFQVSHVLDYYAPSINTANFKVRCGTIGTSGNTTYINRNGSGNVGVGKSSAVSHLRIYEFDSTVSNNGNVAKTA